MVRQELLTMMTKAGFTADQVEEAEVFVGLLLDRTLKAFITYDSHFEPPSFLRMNDVHHVISTLKKS